MATNITNDQNIQPEIDEYLSDNEARFACNICFESAKDVVTTRCGHLYCWQCLYIWLEPGMNHEERRYLGMHVNEFSFRPINEARRICPVCKSACSVKEVIPIYVRECTIQEKGHGKNNEIHKSEKEDQEIEEKNVDLKSEENVNDNDHVATNETEINDNNHGENESFTAQNNDTGLRRRTTQQIGVSTSTNTSAHTLPIYNTMPSRPLPPPSRIQTTQPNPLLNNRNIGSRNGRSPALALHQSLFQALVAVQTNSHQSSMMNQQQNSNFQSSIPSLHNRYTGNRMNATNDSSNNGNYEEDSQLDATQEFLSRLLLMLGCFVILCLLLF